jgi:hypothetical protein
MNAIKEQLQNDQEILKALSQVGCTFEFIWELSETEKIGRLKTLVKDELTVAAFYKQHVLGVLRGYKAAAGILPAPKLKNGDNNK